MSLRPLAYYEQQYRDRDQAIVQAYARRGYSVKEIGDHFRIDYSEIGRIVRRTHEAKGKTPLLPGLSSLSDHARIHLVPSGQTPSEAQHTASRRPDPDQYQLQLFYDLPHFSIENAIPGRITSIRPLT